MDKLYNTLNSRNEIICPYCGHMRKVDDDDFSLSDDLNCEEEMECEKCGKTFLATQRVTFEYETFEKE